MSSWDDQDHYLSQKELKKDKKLRAAKDQSRYKQSNQSKEKAASLEIKHRKGLVQTIRSQEIYILDNEENKSYLCTLRGSLKKEQKRLKNLIVVGDFVDFEVINSEQGVIHQVLPRSSRLSRAGVYAKGKEHIIAANLDQLLITVSLKAPQIKWTLIDRFLIAAKQGNITPIVIINKIDLLTSDEERKELEDLLQTYKGLGVEILAISGITKEGLEQIKALLKDKVSSFAGPSGTGKSTILSHLLGKKLRVGELASRSQKGAHTTTRGEIFPLKNGGSCIDTPGIKSFSLWDQSAELLQQFFPEILEHSQNCKFPNCKHINEPKCAVKDAVEEKAIHPKRYLSYKNIYEGLGKKDLNR